MSFSPNPQYTFRSVPHKYRIYFFEAEKQKNIKNRDSYKMKYRFFVRLIQNNYFCNPFPKE